MPRPFSVNYLDVDHNKHIVQNAFYNFWYLKSKTLEFDNSEEEAGATYKLTFFEDVRRIEGEKTTVLGFFSPVIPEGQPSNKFSLDFGDVCKESREGDRWDLMLSSPNGLIYPSYRLHPSTF